MRSVKVNASTPYDILIGNDLLDRCGELCLTVSKPCRVCIVTDDTVAALYLERAKRSMEAAGFDVLSFVFPHGEASKNTDTLVDILEFLAENRLTRSDLMLALGGGEEVQTIVKLAAFQIQGLLVAYKERFDKDNFIKNLLLDNLLLVDIYNRAKKLHIDTDVKRVIFIIEVSSEKDANTLEKVRTILGGKSKDFITAVDEKNIILVREVKPGETYEDLEKTANTILDMLNTEAMSKVHIAFGTIVNEIKDVSRSYKEAKMALDVGKIFYSGKNVVAYSNLGIGRLIYQLPLPLCRMFIKEIFDGKNPDEFDEETLTTINKFFENSLNVSETSRQLYIHRNTLVYRLDKLQKSTGLDLRVFEDAITFKIALMVVKYMKYMENLDY